MSSEPEIPLMTIKRIMKEHVGGTVWINTNAVQEMRRQVMKQIEKTTRNADRIRNQGLQRTILARHIRKARHYRGD